MPRGPKAGYVIDSNVHAQKSADHWYRFGYCGDRTEITRAVPVGVFRATADASPCGGCVCAIEDEHRKGAMA